jgi:hypothetical protein
MLLFTEIRIDIDEKPEIDICRLVPLDANSDACYSQIQNWIGRCSKHEKCSNIKPVLLPKRLVEVPSDPVDPLKLHLSSEGETGTYLVLSHCWGTPDFTKLTTTTLAQFQTGIDVTLLPRNFADAITITRRLGHRYIWIDALSILQDNAEDWATESPKMASIYGQAALMISATAAKDSNTGILQQNRKVHYSPALGKDKDLYLRQHLLRWDWDVERSPLAERGWAAQERMLAPRIVHYTRRQLIWECASEWWFEASGIPDKMYGSGQVDQFYSKASLQPIVMAALAGFESIPNMIESHQRMRAWYQCIVEYSGRRLTVSSDKLPAVSGLAGIIDNGTVGEYLAGTWSHDIAAGLTWSRQSRLLERPKMYRAPSWSWASLDGCIGFLPLAHPLSLNNDADHDWAKPYELKLVEHEVLLQQADNPYMGVLEGSYITIEGACMTTSTWSEAMNEFPYNLTAALDSHGAYDCPCCHPDHQSAVSPNEDKPAFDMVLILRIDLWEEECNFVDMLLLKWVDETHTNLRRIGICILQRFDASELESVREKLDKMGWERRVLKLV